MKKIFKILSVVLIVVAINSGMAYATIGPIQVSNPDEGPKVAPSVSPSNNNHYLYTGPNDFQFGINNINNMWYLEFVKALEKGWHTNSVGRYYYKGDGTVYTNGWHLIEGKHYYFDIYGYVYRNKWIQDANTGSWYFVDTDGALVTGWQHIDNVWYYFNPENGDLYGTMAKNTVMYISDPTFGYGFYAFNDDGSIVINSWYHGHYYASNGMRIY